MKIVSKRKTSRGACNKRKQARKVVNTAKRNHPKFGTSKLEVDFARDFLDKLGLKYIYQFEAKSIGRWFDYAIISSNDNERKNGDMILLEINGSYWHGDPRIYEEKELNKTQLKNKRVDEYKKKWALSRGIPIYYIWEKDIRENPKMVMSELKKKLGIEKEKMVIKEEKSKRHINKLKKKSNGS